jgi:O-acetyl-ADP-ribose deacetylase (regulator of RNase III)
MIIDAVLGDLFDYIEEYKIDGIMNAANGIGMMGRGIAGAIKKQGGDIIQTEAFKVCKNLNPQAGQAYVTSSGKLADRGIKKIIHAVTMKEPGGATSIDIIKKAFRNAIGLAIKEDISVLACTALGTGVGQLDYEEVASAMFLALKELPIFTPIHMFLVDYNNKFIDRINELNEDYPLCF